MIVVVNELLTCKGSITDRCVVISLKLAEAEPEPVYFLCAKLSGTTLLIHTTGALSLGLPP